MKMDKKRIIYTAIVTLIVVFTSTFAILMTLERTDYRNYLQGEYSKNMYNLIDSVQNIRINLSKAAIAGSREQNITVFEEIFRHSSMANDKLHSLPISQKVLGDTSEFLSQVGDFCFTLSKNSSQGKELNNKDYDNIDRLKEEAFGLEQELNKVASEIGEGRIRWGEIRKKASGVLAKNDEKMLEKKFTNIQKQVVQYPALIYDGPFSDNILEITPKINSQKKVSQKQAEEILKKVVGKEKIKNINFESNKGKERIDSYRFNVITNKGNKDENIICQISKKGGKVVYLINNRKIDRPKITLEKALKKANNYLKNIGYKNMVPTYTLKYDNTVVISYVYKQDEVIMYPDQIKLKVALDNGDIIGIESEKYLVSHEENRKIPTPKVTEKQARERVSKRLNINSVKLVIVPTETNKEALCYQFSGSYKEDNFVVYINALTGYEQKIIQIINTPNGKLTI